MTAEDFSDFTYGFFVSIIILPFIIIKSIKFIARELR